MINLLPLTDKEAQHKERRSRVVTVFLFLFIVVEIISVVLLLVPYFMASAKGKVVKNELALLEQKIAREGGESYADIVKNTNEQLSYFFDTSERRTADSVFMERIMNTIPQGVSVTDMTFDPIAVEAKKDDKDKDAKKEEVPNGRSVHIGGVAANRTALLTFVDSLKATEGVSEVDLPVSNFTQSVDIDFTISFNAI